MANNSGPSRRESMRLKAEAEEARGRRNGRILWISLAVVAVAVAVIIALVVSQAVSKSTPSAEQMTPPRATQEFGIQMESKGAEPADGVPNLVIWEDFQCPACAAREEVFGPIVDQLVDEGKITAEIRTAHFLDAGLRNDASERAANAAAAADAVGKYREFHKTVYLNQPAREGDGYTDEQLRVDFPTQAGIEGDDLTKFQELYDGRAFADFVTDAQDQFSTEGISGTPTYKVGDTVLEFGDAQGNALIQPTAEDMLRAINEAA